MLLLIASLSVPERSINCTGADQIKIQYNISYVYEMFICLEFVSTERDVFKPLRNDDMLADLIFGQNL